VSCDDQGEDDPLEGYGTVRPPPLLLSPTRSDLDSSVLLGLESRSVAISLDTLFEEDSDDLTEDEANTSTATTSVEGVVAVLKNLTCPSCGSRPEPIDHALRRRAGHYYWKVQTRCSKRHELTVVLQTDWIRGAG